MVVRTSAIDRLIYEALQSGVDTVLNLGAGLDTQPYRMKLPATLRWIELDFPNIVELKNSKLVEYKPACRLERVGVDLLDRRSRNTLLGLILRALLKAMSQTILSLSGAVLMQSVAPRSSKPFGRPENRNVTSQSPTNRLA